MAAPAPIAYVTGGTPNAVDVTWTLFDAVTTSVGETLVAFIAIDNINSSTVFVSAPGWEVVEFHPSAATVRSLILRKIADGPTTSLTLTLDNDYRAQAVMMRLPAGFLYEIVTASNAVTSTNPNPPQVTIPEVKDTLFVAFCANNVALTGVPSGYTSQYDVSVGFPKARLATKTATASSDNPGTFSAASGTHCVSTTAIYGLNQYPLSADAGSLSITGGAVDFRKTTIFQTDGGTFSLAGTAANLLKGFKFAADPGSFALGSTPANFLRSRVMPADAGSFILGSTALTMHRGYAFIGGAAAGAFSLAGAAINFGRTYILAAGPGAYTLGGFSIAYENLYRYSAGTIAQMVQDAGVSAWANEVAAPPGDPIGGQWYELDSFGSGGATAFLYPVIDMPALAIGDDVTLSFHVYKPDGFRPINAVSLVADFFLPGWSAIFGTGTFFEYNDTWQMVAPNFWRFSRRYRAQTAGAKFGIAGPVRYPAWHSSPGIKFTGFQIVRGGQPLPYVVSNGAPGSGMVAGGDASLQYARIMQAETFGPENIPNPDMSVPADWATTIGTITVSGGQANFAAVSGGNFVYRVPVAAWAGRRFRLTYEVKSISAGAFQARFQNQLGTPRNAPGVYSDDFIANSTTNYIGVAASGTTTGAIDNISFREIAGLGVVGQPANLLKGFKLALENVALGITGGAAGLLWGAYLGASSGAFVTTGAVAGLLFGRRILAQAGSLILSAIDPILRVFRPVATPSERRLQITQEGSRRLTLTGESRVDRRMSISED